MSCAKGRLRNPKCRCSLTKVSDKCNKHSEQSERARRMPPQRFKMALLSFLLLALSCCLALLFDPRVPKKILVEQGIEPHPGPDDSGRRDNPADLHLTSICDDPPAKKQKVIQNFVSSMDLETAGGTLETKPFERSTTISTINGQIFTTSADNQPGVPIQSFGPSPSQVQDL